MDTSSSNRQSSSCIRNVPAERHKGFCYRLRRIFSAKQMYECLQPLLYLTFLHGLTPFYVKKDSKTGCKRLHHFFLGYVNGVAHIIVYDIFYALTLVNNFETIAAYFFSSRISKVGNFMQILSGLIGVTVIYLTAIIPKQRLEKSLKTMNLMDEQLKGVGVKIMYSKVIRFSYIMLVLMTIMNIVYFISTFKLLRLADVRTSISVKITFCLQHTVIGMATTMFNCFTKALRLRITMMNKVLLNIIIMYFVFILIQETVKMLIQV